MAKKTSDNNTKDKNHYSRLIIYKAMRASFIPVYIVLFGVVAFLVYQVNIRDESWVTLVPPLLGILAICCLFPLTENWEYQPWQSKPERYERYNKK